jgi:hypothetical protein
MYCTYSLTCVAGPEMRSDAAIAQFDDTQTEIEAGNAALLQDAPFLITLLANQATALNMHPVSIGGRYCLSRKCVFMKFIFNVMGISVLAILFLAYPLKYAILGSSGNQNGNVIFLRSCLLFWWHRWCARKPLQFCWPCWQLIRAVSSWMQCIRQACPTVSCWTSLNIHTGALCRYAHSSRITAALSRLGPVPE